MISLRPAEHLRAVMRDYPELGPWVDMLRRDRGRNLPDWPEWCFLPMAGWYALACHAHNVPRLDLSRTGEQRFELRWLPPAAVAMRTAETDDL